MITWDAEHACYRWTNPSTGAIFLTDDLAAAFNVVRQSGHRPMLTSTLLRWKVSS